MLLIFIGMGAMLGRILAVDSVDRIGLQDYRVQELLRADAKSAAGRKGFPAAAGRSTGRRKTRCSNRPDCAGRSSAPTTAAAGVPSGPWSSRTCASRAPLRHRQGDPAAQLGHDRHGQARRPPLFEQAAAVAHAHGRPSIGRFIASTGVDAGHASLRDRPVHAGHCSTCVPLVIYFCCWPRLVERFGTTDWGRIFVMAAAVLRHLPDHLCRGHQQPPAGGRLRRCGRCTPSCASGSTASGDCAISSLAGLFAALPAANELPAAVAAGRRWRPALLWKAPRPTLLAFVPPAVLVAAAFFGTNWIAVAASSPPICTAGGADNWYDYTYERNGRDVESYWNHPSGHRPRRAFAGRLRAARLGGPSRHLFAHARLAVEPVGMARCGSAPRRPPAAAGRGRHLRPSRPWFAWHSIWPGRRCIATTAA